MVIVKWPFFHIWNYLFLIKKIIIFISNFFKILLVSVSSVERAGRENEENEKTWWFYVVLSFSHSFFGSIFGVFFYLFRLGRWLSLSESVEIPRELSDFMLCIYMDNDVDFDKIKSKAMLWYLIKLLIWLKTLSNNSLVINNWK